MILPKPAESGRLRDEVFAPPEKPGGLRRKTVRSAAMTFGSQGVKFLMALVSIAILARILTPEDFGLIAMTATATGFLAMFKDAGLGAATVQRPSITHEQISTLFWINVCLALLISLIMFLTAPLVAAFYGEERLVTIMRVLALSFLIGGTTVQHNALMRRQMRFSALAWIDMGSTAAGIITAVAMAKSGCGYWSLVGMAIATALVSSLSTWMALPWMPGPPKRNRESLAMLRFGGDILTFNIVNYFARQADNLLIGWKWGAATLALYDKAYSMLLMPIRQINGPMSSVVVAALSRVEKEPERFSRLYLRALELMVGVSVPLVLGLCVFAESVVYLWLGPQWASSADLFRLLTPAAVIGAMLNPVGWLMIASGNTRTYKYLGIASSILIVAAFVIGLPHGAKGVAAAYSLVTLLNFFPTWWIATRNTVVRFGSVMRTFVAPVSSALAASVAAYPVILGMPGAGHLRTIGIAGVVYGAAYGLVMFGGFRRWKVYREVLRELRMEKNAR